MGRSREERRAVNEGLRPSELQEGRKLSLATLISLRGELKRGEKRNCSKGRESSEGDSLILKGRGKKEDLEACLTLAEILNSNNMGQKGRTEKGKRVENFGEEEKNLT